MRILGLALGWGWAAAIVWLSLTPSPPQVELAYGDKLGHLGAYGLLMFWFAWLHRGSAVRAAHAAVFVAMGIALEFAQGSLGHRSYEAVDMAANTLGVALGWGGALLLQKMLR